MMYYYSLLHDTMIRVRDIDRYADYSFEELEKRLQVKDKLEEPDYTAALATIFPRLLNSSHVLGKARIGGCYIHQKPKVKFNSNVTHKPAVCEAGDLLVLCRRTIDARSQLNATIFQIKKQDNYNPTHRTSKVKELIQLELYQTWPNFVIPSVTANTVYDVRPKAITPGAQYLCISPTFDSKYRLLFHSLPATEIELYNQYTLGYFISSFIDWQNGRPISPVDDKIKDAWSEFIWQLIDVSMDSYFKRSNVGLENEPRTSDRFFSLMMSDSETTDDIEYMSQFIINANKEMKSAGNGDGGFSILFIDFDGDHVRERKEEQHKRE